MVRAPALSWIRGLIRSATGAEAREQAAAQLLEDQRRANAAAAILSEHEARDDFGAQEALDRLTAEMPDDVAAALFAEHIRQHLQPVLDAALEDRLLTPDEEAQIEAARLRYGGIQIGDATKAVMKEARAEFNAWHKPLEPSRSSMMLKAGEWSVVELAATAYEERSRTVRLNYAGPTMRIPIAYGISYRLGSISAQRVKEDYQHSFGRGTLAATNRRLLWVGEQRSLSINLNKIVKVDPFSDGLRIVKDTGKPVVFAFGWPDRISLVKIVRAVEELR